VVILKSSREIEILRQSNRIVAEILAILKEACKPGVSTYDLNRIAEEEAQKRDCHPAFKGYMKYPASVCTSINHEIVHGIPKKTRILKEGDIISIDFGVIYKGYVGDAALTVPIGTISKKAAELLRVTEESLYKGIEQSRIGNRISDISRAIQSHVEAHGFSVVRDFVGHGVGKKIHEDPQVPNFVTPEPGIRLKSGMVLALEPMVNIGTYKTQTLSDGWTAITTDHSLSAHFEHSIAITENGPDILSKL
jgi:methionyl aminopeptidase